MRSQLQARKGLKFIIQPYSTMHAPDRVHSQTSATTPRASTIVHCDPLRYLITAELTRDMPNQRITSDLHCQAATPGEKNISQPALTPAEQVHSIALHLYHLCLIYLIYVLHRVCTSARCVCALLRTPRCCIKPHPARILLYQLPIPELHPAAWQHGARARASGCRQHAHKWKHTCGQLPCAAARAAHTQCGVSSTAARH